MRCPPLPPTLALAALLAAAALGCSSPAEKPLPVVRSGGCSPHAFHGWTVPMDASDGAGGAGGATTTTTGGAGGAGGAASIGGAGGAGGAASTATDADAGAEDVDCVKICQPKVHCAECSKVAVGGYAYACKRSSGGDAGGPVWVCLATYACAGP